MGLQGAPGGITDIEVGVLDDLLDVAITNPSNTQVLTYSNGQWINSAGGGGAGTVTSVSAGVGLTATPNPITGAGQIDLANTAVSAGIYTLATITVDAQGRLTAASNGAAGSGTVTSAAVSGNNGITVAGSPITTQGVITLGLGDITPLTINTSSGTFTGKLTGVAAAFSGKVSADAGINTTTVSAASIGVTGDINAAAGRLLASAATLTSKLTGATAAFSGLVSADGGIKTTAVSADSIGVTGDINAAAGRVIASAMTLSSLLTGQAGTFSATLSASNLGGTNTGDVTVAGQGYITIAGQRVSAGLIANSNMANMNAVTMKANATTSAAAPADVSFSTFLDAAVSAAQGDIIFRGASVWQRLAAGTSGQYLQTLGVSANPAWGTIAAGGTVTSAGISGPSIITWSNTPITTQGVFTGVLANQNANLILAGPVSGAAAAPTFRAQINEDLPVQSQIAVVSIAFNGNTVADASLGSYFRGVAVSAFTLSANNARDGQKIIFEIRQDGTGSRVMTAGSQWAFGTDITGATLSTAASATDFVGGFYNSGRSKLWITAFVKGY